MSIVAKIRRWFADPAPAGHPADHAQGPSTPLSDDQRMRIEHNIRLATEELSKAAGRPMPPGDDGVAFLDGFIERQRDSFDGDTRRRLADISGCYLGACLIATYGGRWVDDPHGVGVELTPAFTAFPLAKAHKQWEAEPGDSVLGFFRTIPALIGR